VTLTASYYAVRGAGVCSSFEAGWHVQNTQTMHSNALSPSVSTMTICGGVAVAAAETTETHTVRPSKAAAIVCAMIDLACESTVLHNVALCAKKSVHICARTQLVRRSFGVTSLLQRQQGPNHDCFTYQIGSKLGVILLISRQL
jgi:hypothetical protein